MKPQQIKQFRRVVFLLDILKLALTAFGGPQLHFTLFHKRLVQKKKYISENDLKELNSLCSMLPGPSSTQTITAIGFKIGGPSLAFLTLAVWILPASLLMTIFAIIVHYYALDNPKLEFLRFIQPMAVGFIVFAAYKISQLFVTRGFHWALLIMGALAGIIAKQPFIFPLLLLIGGVVSGQVNKSRLEKVKPIKNINWSNFFLFIGVFLLAALLGNFFHYKPILLFENTYRYGSIVFGGGHVLIPMMYNQFVTFKHYLEANEFLAGVGVLQAIPGPVFSISTYTSALAMSDWGISGQLLGAVIGTSAIFLPGIFLIFFIYPIWNQVKMYSPVKNAIEGINATSAGLVIASAYLLFEPVELTQENMMILLGTLFLLLSTRVPNPIIVLLCILAGFVI